MSGSGAYGRSAGRGLVFGSVYVLAIFLPLAAFLPAPSWQRLNAYGKTSASLVLIVSSLLALQPVLAGRLKTLDRQFGLDVVYVVHKTMGMIAALLQFCALAVFLADPAGTAPASVWAATALITVLALTALLHRELGLSYEAWRRLHNLLFASVFIAVFIQAWRVVRDAESPLPAMALAALALSAAAAYGSHKILGPALRRKGLYRVTSVEPEAPNVWTLTFEPPESGQRFAYLPGQFQFITFNRGRGQEHPFTISSSPSGGRGHASTIKGSGDFTRTLGALRPGDEVGIQAPVGRFSHVLEPGERKLAFIAGGIGITPFMSMLRYMRDTGDDRDVVLFYANRSEDDIVFRRELDGIAARGLPRLRVVHVLTDPGPDWNGETGRIDLPLLERHAKDLGSRLIYFCGPPPMMNALAGMLIEAGVPPRRIRSERFAL